MINSDINIVKLNNFNFLEKQSIESNVDSFHEFLPFSFLESQTATLKEHVEKFQKLLLKGSNSADEKIITYEEKLEKLLPLFKNRLNLNVNLKNYGNKHYNLINLERLFSHLELKGIFLPIPVGLESDLVESFLKLSKPEIFIQRNFLAEKVKEYRQASTSSNFFDDPEVKKSLTIIQLAITEAFFESKDHTSHPLVTKAIAKQLEGIKQSQSYLMVRSTGREDIREDTDQSSNAGGNVSKAYVLPDEAPFLSAVEEVIHSYFSETSLKNCINAGQNPFEGKPELAVTTQELSRVSL